VIHFKKKDVAENSVLKWFGLFHVILDEYFIHHLIWLIFSRVHEATQTVLKAKAAAAVTFRLGKAYQKLPVAWPYYVASNIVLRKI